MDNQANKYKQAIIDVLLKRIVPLEKQLESQSEIINELSHSLEALTKLLSIDSEPERSFSVSELNQGKKQTNEKKDINGIDLGKK